MQRLPTNRKYIIWIYLGQQKKLWGFLKKSNLLWNYYIPTKKADQLIQFTTKTKPLIFFTSKFTSVYSTWINKARTRVPPISGPSHMLNKKAVENYCTNSENWYLKGVTARHTRPTTSKFRCCMELQLEFLPPKQIQSQLVYSKSQIHLLFNKTLMEP